MVPTVDHTPLAKLCDLVLTEFVSSESLAAELAPSPEGGSLRFRQGPEWRPVMAFPAAAYAALLARLRSIGGPESRSAAGALAGVTVNGVTHKLHFAPLAPAAGEGLVLTRAGAGPQGANT